MKKILLLVLTSFSTFLFAQDADTTIYNILSEPARFPGCEQMDTTETAKNQCAETNLLLFFNQNIVYPEQARLNNTTGQVVISFVVEKDGFISNPTLLRDIGDGCGDEALRVANGMNSALRTAGIQWKPGKNKGVPVRSQVTLPIKFKLQEPLDYILIDFRDTVYTVLDDSLSFQGGHDALEKHVQANLKTPVGYEDSCQVGSMDITVLTRPDGYVRVVDVVDYWNLGTEYLWQAIRASSSTWGKWKAATRKGREVPSAYDFSVTFLPKAAACQQDITNFEKANQAAEEGSRFFNEGKQDEGIAKLSEAIQLFPENANFLYLRGQAYMNMDRLNEACEDFTKVRGIVSIPLVEQLTPIVCNEK